MDKSIASASVSRGTVQGIQKWMSRARTSLLNKNCHRTSTEGESCHDLMSTGGGVKKCKICVGKTNDSLATRAVVGKEA